MQKETIENQRQITLGIPDSQDMSPITNRGYQKGQSMNMLEFTGLLEEIPTFYPLSLDTVPRGKQAQVNVLASTAVYAAQIGDLDSAFAILEHGKTVGVSTFRRLFIVRAIKKSLKAT